MRAAEYLNRVVWIDLPPTPLALLELYVLAVDESFLREIVNVVFRLLWPPVLLEDYEFGHLLNPSLRYWRLGPLCKKIATAVDLKSAKASPL